MSPVRHPRGMSRARRAVVVAVVFASAHAVRAQTSFTWSGLGTDNALTNPANWVGAVAPADGGNNALLFGNTAGFSSVSLLVPHTTQSVTFNSTNTYSVLGAPLVLGNTTANQVVLSVSGPASVNLNNQLAFSNPSTVTATGANLDLNSSVTVATRIDFNAGAGRAINFSGPLSLFAPGSVLNAAGPGTVTFNGGMTSADANASVVASGGTMIVGAGGLVPNLVISGATVRFVAANRLFVPGNSVAISAGLLEITGTQTGSILALSGGTVTSTAALTFQGITASASAATPARLAAPFSSPSVSGTSAVAGGVALDIDGPSLSASVTYSTPGTATFRFLPGTSVSPLTQTLTASGNVTFQLNGGTPVHPTGTVSVPANASLTLAASSPITFFPTITSTGALTVGNNVTLDNPSTPSGTLALTGGTVRLTTAGRFTSATAVSVSTGSLQISANHTGSSLTLAGGSVTGTGTVTFSSLLATPPQSVGVGGFATTPRLAVPFSIPTVSLDFSPIVTASLQVDAPSLAPTVTYSSTSPHPSLPVVRFTSSASTTSSVIFSGTGASVALDFGSPVTNGGTFTVSPGARLSLSYNGIISNLDANFIVSGILEPSPNIGFPATLRNVVVTPTGTFHASSFLNSGTLTNSGSVSVLTGSSLATASVLNSGTLSVPSPVSVNVGVLSNTASGTVSAASIVGTVFNAGSYTPLSTGLASVLGSYTHLPGANLNFVPNPSTGLASFEVAGALPTAAITLNGPLSVPAFATVRATGTASLINNSALSLTGGTLVFGNGATNVNNGTITGFGTLSTTGPAPFTNNGTFSLTGPLTLTGTTQLFNRTGILDFAPGASVSASQTLNNAATLTLRGGSVSAPLSNTPSGVITASANLNSLAILVNTGLLRVTSGASLVVSGFFANPGSLRIDDGTFHLNSPGQVFGNSGLISLGTDASLVGSSLINNLGRLTGSGTVGLGFLNSIGGRIEPSANGSLTFLTPMSNTGTISLPSGTSAVFLQGIPSNSGTISLAGGSLDTNSTPLTNSFAGNVAGFGTVFASNLLNQASITLAGGLSVFNTPVSNAPTRSLRVQFGTALFNFPVINSGNLTVSTGGTAVYTATLNGLPAGTPASDGAGTALSGTGLLEILHDAYVRTDGLHQGAVSLQGVGSLVPILEVPSRQPAGTLTPAGRSVPQSVSLVHDLFISFSENAQGVRTFLGRVDLADNDMILRPAGNFVILPGYYESAAAAFLNSAGQRGIGSSSSLPFTRLAVVSNDSGFGFPRFATFGDLPLTASDILFRYTYLGDTDLSGTLDARDFNAVLNGWSNNLSGWHNGDVNYDNVVDATDFQLFLTAYQTYQLGGLPNLGSPLDYGTGGGAAIPEPTALSLLALPALALRRRCRR